MTLEEAYRQAKMRGVPLAYVLPDAPVSRPSSRHKAGSRPLLTIRDIAFALAVIYALLRLL